MVGMSYSVSFASHILRTYNKSEWVSTKHSSFSVCASMFFFASFFFCFCPGNGVCVCALRVWRVCVFGIAVRLLLDGDLTFNMCVMCVVRTFCQFEFGVCTHILCVSHKNKSCFVERHRHRHRRRCVHNKRHWPVVPV